MSNDERPVPDVSISTENQAKIHWVIPLLIMEMGLLSQMETQKMKSLSIVLAKLCPDSINFLEILLLHGT